MKDPLTNQIAVPTGRSRMFYAAIIPALVVLMLWLVFLVEHVYELEIHHFGILPRDVKGLWGILFSPFIHGDLEHLFNNSVPAFLLGWALMYFYPGIAGRVVLGSWLVSGAWVWISARENYHIGASGVVYGLAAFLFLSGVLRRQRTLMALSLLVVFLYGSMIWGLFPIVPRVSWESHFWGAVAGLLMAYVYRNVQPAVQDPVRVQEDDEDDEESAPMVASSQVDAPMRIVYHISRPAEVGTNAKDGSTDTEGRDLGQGSTSGTWSSKDEGPTQAP